MRTPAGSGSKMKWIGFTGEGSKEKSVLYKVTYYQHLEPRTFHSQNGWYFLGAWIVLQVSHLLKCPKEELWRLSVCSHTMLRPGKRMKSTWRTIRAHGLVAVEQRAVGLFLFITNRHNICGKVWMGLAEWYKLSHMCTQWVARWSWGKIPVNRICWDWRKIWFATLR